MVRIYTRDQRQEGGLELERCAFSTEDTSVLLAYPDGLWLDRAQAVTPYLAPVAKLGAASLLVLPIVWQNDVVGTVVLGFAGAAILSDEDRGPRAQPGRSRRRGVRTAAKDEQLYFQANYDGLDGATEPPVFHGPARAEARPGGSASRDSSRCSSSTSIISSASTTRSATRRATTCCARPPSA